MEEEANLRGVNDFSENNKRGKWSVRYVVPIENDFLGIAIFCLYCGLEKPRWMPISPNLARCPHCFEVIDAASATCRFCDSALDSTQMKSAAASFRRRMRQAVTEQYELQ